MKKIIIILAGLVVTVFAAFSQMENAKYNCSTGI